MDHRGGFCDVNHVEGLGYTLGFGLTSISFTLRTYMASGSWLQNKKKMQRGMRKLLDALVYGNVKDRENIRFISLFKCVT